MEAPVDQETVIGSSSKYHRPSCFIVEKIYRRNCRTFSSWRAAADIGLEPCALCHPYFLASQVKISVDRLDDLKNREPLNVEQLGIMRRGIIHFLVIIEKRNGNVCRDQLGARINRLSRGGFIPRQIASYMNSITETRNVAEYEGAILTEKEAIAIRAAWDAITEWAERHCEP